MIRLATPADAPAAAAIYAPYVTDSVISFEGVPPPAEEMAERIASTLAYAPYLVYAKEGEVLGFAYAARHRERAAYRWSVDVSVYVHHRAHRQGVGRAPAHPRQSPARQPRVPGARPHYQGPAAQRRHRHRP